MDPRKLYGLPNPSGVIEQAQVASGYVSTTRPAPAAFGDPVWIILAEHSTEAPVPCPWGAIHGKTLITQGARVIVNYPGGEYDVPVVVWWEGVYS